MKLVLKNSSILFQVPQSYPAEEFTSSDQNKWFQLATAANNGERYRIIIKSATGTGTANFVVGFAADGTTASADPNRARISPTDIGNSKYIDVTIASGNFPYLYIYKNTSFTSVTVEVKRMS